MFALALWAFVPQVYQEQVGLDGWLWTGPGQLKPIEKATTDFRIPPLSGQWHWVPQTLVVRHPMARLCYKNTL